MPAHVRVRSLAGYAQEIRSGRHILLADEPLEAGGTDRGPDPYALLLAALGACIGITVRLYAERKGWALRSVTVDLRHAKVHARDCAECEGETGLVDRIERRVELEGDLAEAERARLLEIAGRCPVHRTLTSGVTIVEA